MDYAISLILLLVPLSNVTNSTPLRIPTVVLPEVTVTPQAPHPDSVYLLARLIRAEATNEPFGGQIAVAQTVIYRSWRKHVSYEAIIYQKGQYDGIHTKRFYEEPRADHLKAAYYALIGYKVIPYGVQYFHNKKIATDTKWVAYLSNYEFITIGGHTFCWVPNLKPQV